MNLRAVLLAIKANFDASEMHEGKFFVNTENHDLNANVQVQEHANFKIRSLMFKSNYFNWGQQGYRHNSYYS